MQPIHEKAIKTPMAGLDREKMPDFREQLAEMKVYQGHDHETYADYIEAVQGAEAKEAFELACELAGSVEAAGGKALLVGGCVRDEIIGKASKDFDIEIYGFTPEQLTEHLEQYGEVKKVGKAFGVFKIATPNGFELDVSLPRVDSKVAEGHKGFEVEFKPDMTIAEAAKRRDFTFNALYKDPLTGEIFDAYGGVEDLRNRTLRVTDEERFQDDPLRVMRGAQFIGRFGLKADPDTLRLMQSMVPEMKTLSPDRFLAEWNKLLDKSIKPSMALMALQEIGVIDELYPELAATAGQEQEFDWHPEGDVWIHTLLVVDAAADVVREHQLPPESARAVMYAALCHDLGKPATTTFENGRIKSHGHEEAGEAPTRALLANIGLDKQTVDKVANLVRYHLWPSSIYRAQEKGDQVSDGAFRRLAKRLDPATIEELTYVAEADHIGRGPFLDADHIDQYLLPYPDAAGRWVRERAQTVGVYQEKPQSVIMGRDIVSLGFKTKKKGGGGALFGQIISLADELRDEKNWNRGQIIELMNRQKSLPEIVTALQTEIASAA